MLKEVDRIKRAYPDGEPLSGSDAKFVYAVLTNHPRAAAKIGPGVRAITANTFVSNTRCFFVIRTDGTAVDFSARNVILDEWHLHRPPVQTMMDRFPYRTVIRQWIDRIAAATRTAVSR